MAIRFERVGVYALAGAVVGTLCDLFHTHFGVIAYPHPIACGEAWYVPIVMGAAAAAFVLVHGLVRRQAGEPADGALRPVIVSAVWFVGSYAATGLFDLYRIALTLALVSAFIGRALSRPPSVVLWRFALIAIVVGPLAERTLIALGAFRYLHPGLFQMAAWLPGLYAQTALFARDLERRWPVVD